MINILIIFFYKGFKVWSFFQKHLSFYEWNGWKKKKVIV